VPGHVEIKALLNPFRLRIPAQNVLFAPKYVPWIMFGYKAENPNLEVTASAVLHVRKTARKTLSVLRAKKVQPDSEIRISL